MLSSVYAISSLFISRRIVFLININCFWRSVRDCFAMLRSWTENRAQWREATEWRPPGWLLVGLSIRRGTWPRYQMTYPVEGRTTSLQFPLSLNLSFKIHPVSRRRFSEKTVQAVARKGYFSRHPSSEKISSFHRQQISLFNTSYHIYNV